MQSISNKNNRITNKTPQFLSEKFQEHLEGYQLQRQNLQFLEFLQALEDYQQELLATVKQHGYLYFPSNNNNNNQ